MRRERFDELVSRMKARRPLWFELEREAPSTGDEIGRIEDILGATLPVEYRNFVATYGAGLFAFIKVLGTDPETDCYLPAHSKALPEGIVPLADTETGDYYVVRIVDGTCESSVLCWDHDEEAVAPGCGFDNFYALVAAVGMKVR